LSLIYPTRRDTKITMKLSASRTVALFSALLLSSPTARAQGCTQCRDNAAAAPPATQAAYRQAIILLVVTGGTIFAGTVVLLRRSR
jgi:hypothetical protein